MTQALSNVSVQTNSLFFVDNEAGDTAILRLNELNQTLNRINLLELEYDRLNLMYDGISAQINDSVVIAPISGVVMIHHELVPGSFIPGGVQVLTILPERDYKLSTHIFINNSDIGRLTEGMEVRYEIAALPRRDFGDITGKITRISTDITTESGIVGFFIVESEIEDRIFQSITGEEVSLRFGMAFDARIVVDRQRILFYLLDRLNLMIRR